MGHGWKDSLILWLAAWYIKVNLATRSVEYNQAYELTDYGEGMMPNAHIRTAQIIRDAVEGLHPTAQHMMTRVLLNIPTKGE